ncbi:hypothetical protein ACET3Z_026859 [Daucus carota]
MMVKIALTEANIEGESTIFDAIDLCDSSAKADGISAVRVIVAPLIESVVTGSVVHESAFQGRELASRALSLLFVRC